MWTCPGCAAWEEAMEKERGCRRGTICSSHCRGTCALGKSSSASNTVRPADRQQGHEQACLPCSHIYWLVPFARHTHPPIRQEALYTPRESIGVCVACMGSLAHKKSRPHLSADQQQYSNQPNEGLDAAVRLRQVTHIYNRRALSAPSRWLYCARASRPSGEAK